MAIPMDLLEPTWEILLPGGSREVGSHTVTFELVMVRLPESQ